MGVWSYLKGVFGGVDVRAYLKENPFYAKGCASHFINGFDSCRISETLKDARRDLVKPGTNVEVLLDELYLARKISCQVWYTFLRAAGETEEGLAKKLDEPGFQERQEEEIIEAALCGQFDS